MDYTWLVSQLVNLELIKRIFSRKDKPEMLV